MHSSWWYLLDGAQHGPISPEALEALIQQHTLSAEHLVWRTAFADWRRIADIPELAALLPAYNQPNPIIEAETADTWWYIQADQRHGPVDTNTLRLLFLSQQLNANSLIWQPTQPDWMPASTLPTLAAWATPSTPPPVPTPTTSNPSAQAETADPVAPAPLTPAVKTASFWPRLFACLIALLILLLLTVIVLNGLPS